MFFDLMIGARLMAISNAKAVGASLIAFVYCSLTLPIRAMAQTTAPLSIDDALKTRSFGETSPLAFSPDGTKLAYMVQDNERMGPTEPEREIETYIRTGVLLR